jgi:hypothetical protein
MMSQYLNVAGRPVRPTGLRAAVTMRGRFIVERTDPAGRLLERRHVNNTIVSSGQDLLAGFLATGTDSGKQFMSALGIGTGATAPTTNDTNLQARTGNAVTASLSKPSARVWQATANFASDNPSGTAQIQEAAILNKTDTSGFVMWARQTFAVINKGASDNLNLTYSVTFQAG